MPLGDVFTDQDIVDLMTESRFETWQEFYKLQTVDHNLFWSDADNVSLHDMLTACPDKEEKTTVGYSWN